MITCRNLFFTVAILATCAGSGPVAAQSPGNPAPGAEVWRIWDHARHNAFTDLVRFNGQWFCTFREAAVHGVSQDGEIRVITSRDGRQWESAALISSPIADLRDPKISITPDSQLMITAAGALPQPGPQLHQSYVWFSSDGKDWEGPVEVGDPDVWLWRVTWHKDTAYGVGYSTRRDQRFTRFYKSEDGRNFETVVEALAPEGYANETSILFQGDTLLCLLRRDPGNAMLGRAEPPYTDWTWQDLGIRLGGPDMLELPDGRLVVAGRLYDGGARTSLLWLDPDSGELTKFLRLPSGGDTSYPGLVWHEDRLWVSYYSSHEGGKSMIYMAKVDLPGAGGAKDAKAADPIDIGSRLELMVDDHLIESRQDVELRLHKPIPREVSIVHDEPWEGNVTAYHTIFRDDDIYRMYYRGAHYDIETRKITHEIVCYAESRDGMHWTKPELGLVEFKGSKQNNVVWDGKGVHNFVPFKDINPKARAEERYKALGYSKGGLYAFRSPDGLRWSLMSDEPVITKGAFDSQNLAFWDVTRERYVDFHRGFRNRVRDIMTATSKDFLHWTEPVWLEYTGAPAEHLYTNQILPYHRAPHIFLGFPMRFLPQRQGAAHPLPGVSDGVFMSSRDGLTFKRWGEAIIRPGLQQERWVNRNNLTAWGLVETESAIPGTPPELSIYSTEAYYAGEAVRLRRFTWRMDGFVSAQAPLRGGEFTTRPILFEGEPGKRPGTAKPGPVVLSDGKPLIGRQSIAFREPAILSLPGTQDLGQEATLAVHVRAVPAGHRRLFSAYNGGAMQPGKLVFDINSGGGIGADGPSIRFLYDDIAVHVPFEKTSNWSAAADSDAIHHLAATWNDGIVTVYFNGEPVAKGGEAGRGSLRFQVGDLRFGEDYPPTSLTNEPFLGFADDILVVRRALGPDEIQRVARDGAEAAVTSADSGVVLTAENESGESLTNRLGRNGTASVALPVSPGPGEVELLLNFSTSAAGSVRCELLDVSGRPLPGFTLQDSDEIFGDTIEQPVSWNGRTELKQLVGQPVRLRFVLQDADIYAFRFR